MRLHSQSEVALQLNFSQHSHSVWSFYFQQLVTGDVSFPPNNPSS